MSTRASRDVFLDSKSLATLKKNFRQFRNRWIPFHTYSSMYARDRQNFLYNGVSKYRHNMGPLSSFTIVELIVATASISFEDLEVSSISSGEKLCNLVPKVIAPVTTD